MKVCVINIKMKLIFSIHLLSANKDNCISMCCVMYKHIFCTDTDCMTRQFLGNIRPFQIDVADMQGQVVMALNRDCRCQGSCCPCCLQEMYVESPPGQRIATVRERSVRQLYRNSTESSP